MDKMHDFIPGTEARDPVPNASNFSILDSLLRSRLAITKASNRDHQAGLAAPDEIISTNRYNLIVRGKLIYEAEGTSVELRRGTLFFVPAGIRRRWWVPRGNHCELLWCEFSCSFPETLPTHPFCDNKPDLKLEAASLGRIFKLFEKLRPVSSMEREGGDSLLYLQIEGELKASLSRFWGAAKPWKKSRNLSLPRHPSINKAIALIESGYAQSLALEDLYRESALSPNHLRLLFKKQVGSSPSKYLKSIRMRRARALLHQSRISIKEVAGAVGYTDPLYFSRQYHLFWGKSPSIDRKILDPGPA